MCLLEEPVCVALPWSRVWWWCRRQPHHQLAGVVCVYVCVRACVYVRICVAGESTDEDDVLRVQAHIMEQTNHPYAKNRT